MWSRLPVVFLCLLLVVSRRSSVVADDVDLDLGTRNVYSSEQLHAMRSRASTSMAQDVVMPQEIKRRKRGKAGGIRRKHRQNSEKQEGLPSIIMGNVQSLNNKMDELCGSVQELSDFRNISVMSFTESWLNGSHTDEMMSIDGFKLLRGDRDCVAAQKHGGGGVCIYVSRKYCHPNNAFVRSFHCSPNLELLTISIRPYCLPREISHVLLCTVYIPDQSVAKAGSQELCTAIQELEVAAPDALIIVNGDFNHGKLKGTGSYFYQHVKCPTQKDKTLDYCYTNIKEAYSAKRLTKLGQSDHDLLLLLPKYVPIVQRVKPREITTKQWTEEATQRLRGCFESTDWNVFVDTSSDINELTEVVSGYIEFCEDSIIPTKKVKCYSNNKPWITKDVKQIINRKKGIFGRGDGNELKSIQKELKGAIKNEKICYKKKIEEKFTNTDMKQAWAGMRLMSGYANKNSTSSSLPNESVDYANELNSFYNRFDTMDFTAEVDELIRLPGDSGEPFLVIDEDNVCAHFSKLNVTKAAGPDKLSARILKICSSQLAFIFSRIFNLCISQNVIPDLWKQSCIIPVPKKPIVSCMNDLRPVALTSIVMKSLERFVLNYLKSILSAFMDPLQFAYSRGRNTEDAILFTLEKLYSHLELSKFGKVSARIMFFDFSSAFNTIQPHLLANKLKNLGVVPVSAIKWILRYLTQRSQMVKLHGNSSDIIFSNTGAPQGTVLAPFLFTVYTSDIRSTDPRHPLVKFADDSELIALIVDDDDSEYLYLVNRFVTQCDDNYLVLNVSKTKEMVIDFRTKHKFTPTKVVIKGSEVDRVENYKYLGVVIDNQLKWSDHVQYLENRLKTRTYCLRKLNSFHVDPKILSLFYNSIIYSVWTYCIVCWGGNSGMKTKKVLDSVVRRAEKIIGIELPRVDAVYESRVRAKLGVIWKDPDHPLHDELMGRIIPRSGRLRPLPAHTDRHPSSFLGQAIRFFNQSFKR